MINTLQPDIGIQTQKSVLRQLGLKIGTLFSTSTDPDVSTSSLRFFQHRDRNSGLGTKQMEIPLAITVFAGVLLYGVVFFVVALKRGAEDSYNAEDEAPILESQPQLIRKKNPESISGKMTRRAEYASDMRFGGNKVITLPFGSDNENLPQHAQNNQ